MFNAYKDNIQTCMQTAQHLNVRIREIHFPYRQRTSIFFFFFPTVQNNTSAHTTPYSIKLQWIFTVLFSMFSESYYYSDTYHSAT